MDTADTDHRSSEYTSTGFSQSTSISKKVTPMEIAAGPLQPPVQPVVDFLF